MGYCYGVGLGVAKNEKRAVGPYQETAAAGHAHAKHELGSCSAKGLGAAEDLKRAA